MHEPPKKARKGLKSHVRDINALREFVLKTRLMPDNGFEETASGIKPPPRYREYVPMWSPGFSRTDRTTGNGQTFFFFRRGGIVLVPYHSGSTVTQIPQHSSVPLIPLMQDAITESQMEIIVSPSGRDGGTKPPVLIAPRKNSAFNGKSVVVLDISFTGRAENIGGRQFDDGSYSSGVRIDTGFIGGNTGSALSGGDAHTHSGSTLTVDQNKVAVPLSEYNYAASSTTAATVSLVNVDDFETAPKDGTDESGSLNTRIPLGWFQLDEQGYLIDSQWYAEGTLTVALPTGLLKSESSDPSRDPDNITFPSEASDYILPIGAD